MSDLVMKERPISEVRQPNASKRSQKTLRFAAACEPILFWPQDNVDDRLLRVLVVGDDQATTDELSSFVAAWGHDVRCAYGGLSGLASVAAFRPDVLLLDIAMQGMSGINVALQVRRQERLEHCFIIATTGRSDAKHRNRCYQAGVDLLLTKPVTPTHIETLLMLEREHVWQLQESLILNTSRSEVAATYEDAPALEW
jgi:CheY-like chemotaxis protein